MLNQVSQAIVRTATALTIRHPNSVNVEIYRKVADGQTPEVKATPTLGGAMVLSLEDNADYAIERVTLGKMLFLGHLQGADFSSIGTGLTFTIEPSLIEAYIEPVNANHQSTPITLKKDDRVFWVMPGTVMEYQIKAIRSPTQLPPYVNIYVLEPLEHEPDGDHLP